LAARQWRLLVALEHHRAALLPGHGTADTGLMQPVRNGADAALVDESDHQRATLNDVGMTERLLLDARVVEMRAVRAAEILDHEATILVTELCMPPGHHAVVGANRALETATDVDGLGRRQLDRSLPALAVPENQACH
jgi:hypothetical protein